MITCYVYGNGDGASARRPGWVLYAPDLPPQNTIADPCTVVEVATGAPFPHTAIRAGTVRTARTRTQVGALRLIAVVQVDHARDSLLSALHNLSLCPEALATLETIQIAAAIEYEDRRYAY